jgi:hypothetical protein
MFDQSLGFLTFALSAMEDEDGQRRQRRDSGQNQNPASPTH